MADDLREIVQVLDPNSAAGPAALALVVRQAGEERTDFLAGNPGQRVSVHRVTPNLQRRQGVRAHGLRRRDVEFQGRHAKLRRPRTVHDSDPHLERVPSSRVAFGRLGEDSDFTEFESDGRLRFEMCVHCLGEILVQDRCLPLAIDEGVEERAAAIGVEIERLASDPWQMMRQYSRPLEDQDLGQRRVRRDRREHLIEQPVLPACVVRSIHGYGN